MMQDGERVRIACERPPIHHRKEGIQLWERDQEASVSWSAYWAGLVERGVARVVPEPTPEPAAAAEGAEAEEAEESEPPPMAGKVTPPPRPWWRSWGRCW